VGRGAWMVWCQGLQLGHKVDVNMAFINLVLLHYNRIVKVDPQVSIRTPRRIIDTRNRIIHGYDTVSEEIIWGIVIKDLPILK